MENRELKFRSWDSKNKEMDFWDVNNIPMFKTENIMQFTGFKDKKGIETYSVDLWLELNDFEYEVKGNIYENALS